MPEPATTNTANAKIERKYLAHYIDSSFNGTAANYVRLGKDLEEYAIEMNPDSETKRTYSARTRPMSKVTSRRALLTLIMLIVATRSMSTLRP